MSPSALWLLSFLIGMFLVVTVIVLPTIIRDYRRRHQK